MHGTIKTFIPEKLYGFIKGHDGKDYFFSLNAFTDKQHRSLLYDGALVEFEPTATARGYKAINCQLLDPAEIDTYLVPDEFQVSKSETIRGWEIIERGDWMLRTESSDSLDDAKRQLIRRAQSLNANAITELEYLKDTGYSGNYQFTIHIFLGRPAVVAKKSPQGEYRKHDLCVLNQSAADMKQGYAARRNYSRDRRHLVSIFLVGSLLTFLVAMKIVANWDSSLAEKLTVITIILLFVINNVSDRSSWLVKNEKREKS